jgi:rod shape-determining protein MreC
MMPMDWRSSWLKEKKTLVHAVTVLVLSVAVLLSGTQITTYIGNFATSLFYYPFHKLKTTMTRVTLTANDNAALTASVVELSTRLQLYNDILEENRRLRALLGFIPPAEFKIVPTEIVGVFGAGIPNTVMINLGAKDSLMENQTVINRNGVAGRVARVMDDYSVVYLLTEPRCRVAARVKRSREQGIIRYGLGQGMYLDNCPRLGDVVVGDTVITSGLGGIFPEGLVIGTINQVEAPEKEFFYKISVDPAVNFNGLDELYVLIRGGE